MPHAAGPAVPRRGERRAGACSGVRWRAGLRTQACSGGAGQHRDAPLDKLQQHAQHGALDAVRERAILHARDICSQHGVRLAARARRIRVGNPQRDRLAFVAPQQLRAAA